MAEPEEYLDAESSTPETYEEEEELVGAPVEKV